jgi:hypothetical protein
VADSLIGVDIQENGKACVFLMSRQIFYLWHEFEDVWLTDKRTDRKLYIGRHYGDPVQGIIGPDENWFLTAGEGLLFLDFSRETHEFSSRRHGWCGYIRSFHARPR